MASNAASGLIDALRSGNLIKTLLNQMIRWDQVKPALWLLDHGASPNIPDDRGWTAVHQAGSRDNERLMKAVLEAGGDRRRKDKTGDTPFDVAHRMEQPKLFALLS